MAANDYKITTGELDDLEINNTDTSDEADVNDVTNKINEKLNQITIDMSINSDAIGDITDAETNAGISKSYAVGLDLDDNPDEPAEGSSLTHRDAAESARDDADASEIAAGISEVNASGFADDAAASAVLAETTRKNLLLNSNYTINQEGRNLTSASVPLGEYWIDGWKAHLTSTFTRTVVDGYNTMNVTSASNGTGVQQKNDDILEYPDGTTMTISGRADGYCRVEGIGCPLTTISNDELGMKDFEVTFTLTKATNSGFLDFTALFTSDTISVQKLKLEAAPSQSVYEIPPITNEEAKSLRYLRTISESHYTLIGVTTAVDQVRVTMNFNENMSSQPTINLTSGWMTADGLSFQVGTTNVVGYSGDSVTFEIDTLSGGSFTVDHTATVRATGSFDARP
jgi:hypothetical protein